MTNAKNLRLNLYHKGIYRFNMQIDILQHSLCKKYIIYISLWTYTDISAPSSKQKENR